MVAKTRHPPFTNDILGTYKIINQCIVNGLHQINIKAHMAEETRSANADALETFCFSVPSRYELLVCGKKICGSAQVRSHGSFLQHGSLMMAFDPVKTQAVLLPHRDKAKQIEVLTQSATAIMDQTQEAMDISIICRALKEAFEETMHVSFTEADLTTEEKKLKKQLLNKYRDLQWNMDKCYKDTPDWRIKKTLY
jgi:lipoate-protein ligase A